jgi:hypothetical protein
MEEAFEEFFMNGVNHLPFCLMNREMGNIFELENSIESAVNELIQNRIMKDDFYSYGLYMPHRVVHATRNHRYIVATARDSITLFDMVVLRTLWNCNLSLYEGYRLIRSLVSQRGEVLVITEHEIDSTYQKDVCFLFFEGKKIGEIRFDSNYISHSTFSFVNGQIYAYSNKASKDLYVWDLDGRLRKEISISELNTGHIEGCLSNSDFYVLIAGTDVSHIPAKVLVQNLMTQQLSIYDLEYHQDRVSIHSAAFHRNTLVCGLHYLTYQQESSSYISINPKVVVMNLITGDKEIEYNLEYNLGQIKELVVNDDYIVCSIYERTKPANLWAIDRHSGKQKKIPLAIPYCIDDSKINLSISGEFLYLRYSNDNFSGESSRQTFCAFDLSLFETVKKITYKRFLWNEMTFQEGRLVIINTADLYGTNSGVYVEDFERIGNEDLKRQKV